MYAEAALGSSDGIFPDLCNCDTDPDVSDILSDSDESDIIDNIIIISAKVSYKELSDDEIEGIQSDTEGNDSIDQLVCGYSKLYVSYFCYDYISTCRCFLYIFGPINLPYIYYFEKYTQHGSLMWS